MITETIKYLNQAKVFLDTIRPEEYHQPIDLLSNSTIGIHTRHFIECYQCLITQAETGVICYDSRERDTALEENPMVALAALQEIIRKLPTLLPKQSIFLKNIVAIQTTIKSTIERELLHNLEHTTHHLAIIKIGLNLLNSEIVLPENFGVAQATIEHRQQLIK